MMTLLLCHTCLDFHNDPSSFGLAKEQSDLVEPAAEGKEALPCPSLLGKNTQNIRNSVEFKERRVSVICPFSFTVAHHLHINHGSGSRWNTASCRECSIHVGNHTTRSNSLAHYWACRAPHGPLGTPTLLHGATHSCYGEKIHSKVI